MSTTTQVTFAGMTCEHCVASVTEDLSALPGVEEVDVVLATGAVTITSATPLEPSDVESAVTEAGYTLA